jgi:phosphatidylinositol alpha-mannosyltransferase
MAAPETPPRTARGGARKRAALIVLIVLMVALTVFAVSRLDLHRIGHALITATPGWIALGLLLMMLSLFLRACSWQQTLRAAMPDSPVHLTPVIRATMIGVMASAVFPGRVGEPSRVLVLARRLEGPLKHRLPVVAGTVFSQTLINILALAILAGVTFTSVPLLDGHATGVAVALAAPLALAALVLSGPRLLALGRRSRSTRVALAANAVTRILSLARRGLTVFARPRYGVVAIGCQLLAWTLQWLACYTILLALGIHANLAAAAAVLTAVNISAILPATPSNVGVFQAACLVVLAAYGVGAGQAVAYGIILQAVEVITALALGIPALLAEGLRWQDLRPGRRVV